MKNCPLCELAKGNIITRLHYQDNRIIIVDCSTHVGTPMWVLKRHVAQPTPEELEYGRGKCRRLFGENIRFRGPTSIRDHYHEHIAF